MMCQADSGSATGCRPVCDLPAAVAVTHEGYRGPYVAHLCPWHAARLSARIWPYRVLGQVAT